MYEVFVYYESMKREVKTRPDECRCDERLKSGCWIVYYESMNREVKTRPIYECRSDERLKTKVEESTYLTYTGFLGELEHLKIETRVLAMSRLDCFYVVYSETVDCCLLRIDEMRVEDKTYI
jgi:hypothetical protein